MYYMVGECVGACVNVDFCAVHWGSSLRKMANDWFECQIVVSTKVFVTFPFWSSGLHATLLPAVFVTVCPAVHCLLMSQMKRKPLSLTACICSSHFIFTLKMACSYCRHTFWKGEVNKGKFCRWEIKTLPPSYTGFLRTEFFWISGFRFNNLSHSLWKASKRCFRRVQEMFFKCYKAS